MVENGHTFYKIPNLEDCMRKAIKSKKGKVPKISEEEYAAYIALLKNEPRASDGIEEKVRELPNTAKMGK